MKNILAENMLRFGSKNLDTKTKRTLQQLAEQTSMSPSKLATMAPGVDVWLTNLLKDPSKAAASNQIYNDIVGTKIVFYQTSETSAGTSGAGTLWIFTLDATYGWPLIRAVGSLVNSAGVEWMKSPDGNLYKNNYVIPNLKEVGSGTMYSAEKFNTYWANLNSYAPIQPWQNTEQFKNLCVTLTSKLAESFKANFIKYNNIPNSNPPLPYSSEAKAVNGNYKRSSYYTLVDSKITDKIARQIYDIIKDPATIQTLSTPVAQ